MAGRDSLLPTRCSLAPSATRPPAGLPSLLSRVGAQVGITVVGVAGALSGEGGGAKAVTAQQMVAGMGLVVVSRAARGCLAGRALSRLRAVSRTLCQLAWQARPGRKRGGRRPCSPGVPCARSAQLAPSKPAAPARPLCSRSWRRRCRRPRWLWRITSCAAAASSLTRSWSWGEPRRALALFGVLFSLRWRSAPVQAGCGSVASVY